MELLVIGLVAGVLSGLFGIGGGVVIVPAVIVVARMKPEMATGRSLASLLLPVGLLGAWHYYRHGFVQVAPAALIAGGLVLGAWFGASIALRLSGQDLQKAFAIFLVFVAAAPLADGALSSDGPRQERIEASLTLEGLERVAAADVERRR